MSNKSNVAVQSYNLNSELPNLADAKEFEMDLSSEYWEPQNENETKLCFFQGFETFKYVREGTGEAIDLECAIIIEQLEDGSLKTLRNGSKRLVGALQDAYETEKIVKGTPLKITFLGKKKNKNNAYKSDTWSIKPLIVG